MKTANRCAAPSAQVGAHTTAERQEKALEVVVIPRLSLRDEILWRGPLNEPRPLSKPLLLLRKRQLLDFDFGADVLELLLDGRGFVLVHAFLDVLRSAFDEVLGFL